MNFDAAKTRPSSTSSTSSTSFRIPGILPTSEILTERAERDSTSFLSRRQVESTPTARSRPISGAQNAQGFRRNETSSRAGSSTTTVTQTASRPTTGRNKSAQSRPATAMSTLNGAEGSYVCAILEHRGIGREVGIAVMEKETGQCTLTQFGDTPTYVKTVHHLSLHPPATILVPAGSVGSMDLLNSFDAGGVGGKSNRDSSNSVLVTCLEETFDLKVTPLKRIHWNDSEGAAYLDRLLVDDVDEGSSVSRSEINAEASSRNAILTAIGSKFYALSAVCALFKHLEATNSRPFLARTLKIKYASPDGTVMIDSDSARNLELIQNKVDRKTKMSLFGLLNKCTTPMGERLLRMNILQPLTDQSTIENRLDAVEECIQSEDRFFALKEAMKPLGKNRIDLDKLLSSLSKADPERAALSIDPRRTEKKISEILSLRTLLLSLGPIHRALEGASTSLLNVIQSLLSSPGLDEMQDEVERSLNEDLVTGKAPLGNRNARIFAVRSDRSPLLDIARETYSENMADILNLLEEYKSIHKLPITLKWQANGFHLEIKTEAISRRDLPHSFINVNKISNGKIFTFTTLDLKKYNQRLESSLNEVFLLSDSVIEEIRGHILARISELYKSSEALSLLDMLLSFCQLVGAHGYTRPEFVHETLAIQAGRHPILDSLKDSDMVPNNVWSEEGSTFFLITGPNMSGKTTYLCQVALLTIMATIGSFVPAEYASFIIPDCILTRLSNEDSLEQNLSTFSLEMRNTSFILSLASPRSLVIIDELGRATSAHEGFGIAMAVAEELIRIGAFVFFSTHFLSLHETLTTSYRISSQQFQVSMDRGSKGRNGFNMSFHHRLISGCSQDTHYGLELAKLVDLPKDLLQDATEIADKLNQKAQSAQESTQSTLIARRRKIVMDTLTHLDQVLKASTLQGRDLRTLLRGIQQDVVEAMEATYAAEAGKLEEIEEEEEEEAGDLMEE